MDLQTLSQQLATFLAPFLPYLLKMGEKAAEEAAKQLGADAWEQAKALWGKLRKKEQVAKVAEAAAAVPDSKPLQEALREQIARALQEDPQLLQEVRRRVAIISRLKNGNVLRGGKVISVEIGSMESGEVKSEVETGDVSGEVAGVKIGSVGGGKVESEVETGDVSGKVTGVKIERME